MKPMAEVERRKYIRLKTVFPIEFQLLTEDLKPSSDLLQGFTRNIGEGGISIEVNNLSEDIARKLMSPNTNISLRINIPLTAIPAKALAHPVWMRKVREEYPNKYFIGIRYEKIERDDQLRILRYARWLRAIPRLVATLIIILVLGFGAASLHGLRLQRKNTALIKETIQAVQEKSAAEAQLSSFLKKKEELESKLSQADDKVWSLEERLARLDERLVLLQTAQRELSAVHKERLRLEGELERSLKEKEKLQGRLEVMRSERVKLKGQFSKLVDGRSALERQLEELGRRKNLLEVRTAEIMYNWLKSNQNRKTGLAPSFLGESSLLDIAFSYDQALVAQNFVLLGDFDSARVIFDFYQNHAQRIDGGFANAYDAATGGVIEYAVHCGPNIWLAISILQYGSSSGDDRYLDLATQIGDWIISLQKKDPEGGICGGPGIAWMSTEHNLDAYGLFNMLYKKTKETRYRIAADRTMGWLITRGFNQAEGRFNRGRGDSVVATDTVFLAIAAIGPERLLEEGIDPEKLIRFVETRCKVTDSYLRPDGKEVMVTGFDFTDYRRLNRPGVVSTEWTAQMVVALKIMSDFFARRGDSEKAKFYSQKADFYLGELEKLAIVQAGLFGLRGVGLSYATKDWVEVGHGWMTPKGLHTLSVAGTAFGIFAKRGHNPFQFPE